MSVTFTTVPAKRLAESITGASASFKVNNIKGWDGNNLTSADFGTRLWAVFRNSAATLMEIMEVDPASITSPSSPITIITRGLKFNGDQSTSVAGNKLTWVKGDTVIELGTHVPQLLESTVRINGAQTIDDLKTFTTLPQKSGSLIPTVAAELATKSYVDSVGTGSATYDQNIFAGTAGETFVSGDLCYFKMSDQRWYKAKSSAAASSIGVKLAIAQSAGTAGVSATFLGAGLAKNLTGLTAGLEYFVSNGTFGALSTVAGTFGRYVGRAITTTTLHFDPTNGTALTQMGAELYGVDASGSDDYAISLVPALTAYQDGMVVRFKAGTTNTGAATLNINGLGAKTIKKNLNGTLADGDIVAGQDMMVMYDLSQDVFQVIGLLGTLPVSTNFGDGSDGVVVIAAGTTTLTRDMYYSSLTIQTGGILNPAGFRIFVSGTLTYQGTGVIACNGGNGVTGGTATQGSNVGAGGAGGTAAASAGSLPPVIAGGAGGAGATGASGNTGTVGVGGTSQAKSLGNAGSTGGAGATGGTSGSGTGPGAGGSAGVGGTQTGTIFNKINSLQSAYYLFDTQPSVASFTISASSGGGGGGGGGRSANAADCGAGGGGGGAGAPGGIVWLAAKSIVTVNGNDFIQAKGGAAGNGGGGGNSLGNNGGGGSGGGGGAGGAGGVIILFYHSISGSGTTNVSGGAFGTGGALGTKNGTGTDGTAGSAGSVGLSGVVYTEVV